MDQPSTNAYSIRAVQRVCDILDLIQENPEGFTLTQVAERAAFPKSSAFRYLATLEERRYVRRDEPTGLFRIGAAFLPLQSQQLNVLADRARPQLNRLRDRFSETINLGILDRNRVSYIEIVESPKSVRLAARPGDRDPIHCTALGKAIASTLDLDRVKAILAAEGMPRRTRTTITSVRAYLSELDRIRELGYAIDDQENEDEGRCVAVPLPGIGLPASISLSAPASRFATDQVPAVAAELQRAAETLVKDFTGV
ncbi:IclR family transcriptional regulator [Microlunatus sp. GCM10028923]|uniref:IclR family transcriptional regulator n=1 Tax=Microlunatus sp. GCM10028923 TaxID=3273400 RepID=UPI00361B4717